MILKTIAAGRISSTPSLLGGLPELSPVDLGLDICTASLVVLVLLHDAIFKLMISHALRPVEIQIARDLLDFNGFVATV
eukprot:84068-Amorphochlora_amoeboformis.AAC.1